ncbi:MAG: GDSL-type esterase/lipase family protein [Opitutales bacterium]
MHWYENEIQALEREKKPLIRNGETVVFYGSSSIRLWDSLESEFPGYHVLNMGFGGSTLAGCGWFFDRMLGDVQPKALVLYAGDNDLGDGRHPEEIYLFFEAIHGYVRAYLPDMPFTFISVKPSPVRMHLVPKMKMLNEWVAQSLEPTPHETFVDVFNPMMNCGQNLQTLYTDDGLHMNSKGYDIWKSVLMEHRNTIFGG